MTGQAGMWEGVMDDRSIGKETRDLTPFLDLLDLHDLILAGDDTGGVARSKLPGVAAGASRPAAEDASAQSVAKLAPLPSAPAASAPVDADGPAEAIMQSAPVAAAQPLSVFMPGGASGVGALSAKSGAAAGQSARPSKEPASSREISADEDRDIDGIRARIEQNADVDQDADAEVMVRADNTEVSVRVDADAEVDQQAAIRIEAEAHPADEQDIDPSHDISIAGGQEVDIDTVVRVDVTGYIGEVVVNVVLSEKADVDQQAIAIYEADTGNDVFDIDISQYIDVDLLSDIDISVREVGGRLYIDLLISDVAQGEDVLRLEVEESADDVLDISLRQHVDIEQRISVDLDVESQLAELFDIDIDVDAESDLHVRQVAAADADLAPDGRTDLDLDGESRIEIDNQLHIRIDFSAA
ncbi:MAG: hypothetical protein ACRCTI_07450 [Beijerinckiaceae bacterium]